jgi:putative ABC transport system substrate-binding protein
MQKKLIFISIVLLLVGMGILLRNPQKHMPLVAIANYGPHSSIDASVVGLKEALKDQGYIENESVRYHISDVGFDTSLIPQMLTRIKSQKPDVIVLSATPVAQYAKSSIKEIPLVFNVITDPVAGGLLKDAHQPDGNMTGASDRQDLQALVQFAKKLLPAATRVGMLYSTSEANDKALLNMLQAAADATGMQVVAVPIEQARDVPLRMKLFKDKVDFIYVGASGPIQPALPAIAAEARRMGIPLFNVDDQAVISNQVLASFGVDYLQEGRNAGNIVARILKGDKVADIAPHYPSIAEHKGVISKRQAADMKISIPADLSNATVVE